MKIVHFTEGSYPSTWVKLRNRRLELKGQLGFISGFQSWSIPVPTSAAISSYVRTAEEEEKKKKKRKPFTSTFSSITFFSLDRSG